MKKKTNRTKQAEKTKKKIFKAGIELLKEKGFENVNITDISKKAKVSVGSFYHYYNSKQDLFMDLYRGADTKFETEVRNEVEGLETNSAILTFFDEYSKLALNDGIDIIKQIYIPDNHLFISGSRPMYDLLFEIIEKDQLELVSFNESSTKEICDDLFLIGRGVVFDWALHDGEYDLIQKMRTMISSFLA